MIAVAKGAGGSAINDEHDSVTAVRHIGFSRCCCRRRGALTTDADERRNREESGESEQYGDSSSSGSSRTERAMPLRLTCQSIHRIVNSDAAGERAGHNGGAAKCC